MKESHAKNCMWPLSKIGLKMISKMEVLKSIYFYSPPFRSSCLKKNPHSSYVPFVCVAKQTSASGWPVLFQ